MKTFDEIQQPKKIPFADDVDNVTEQADELPNNLFKKNALMLGQELSSQEQPLKNYGVSVSTYWHTNLLLLFLLVGEDASLFAKQLLA